VIRLPRRPAPEMTTRRPRFTEGLVARALIGAAIAGSTLWSKLRRSRETEPSPIPEAIQVAPSDEEHAPG